MKQDPNFIYGKNPVLEALKSNLTIEKVLIHNTLRGELEMEVRKLCKQKLVPLKKVPVDKLDYLTRKQNHQGVAAFLSPINFMSIEDVISLAYDEGRSPFLLILEGVTDVRNVGALARTAHVFGVDAIVYPMKHSARINEDTVKISAGALLKIPVCREPNMEIILKTCKIHGIPIIASDLEADQYIEDIAFEGPCALVMGSEDRGITLETKRMADQLVKIDQSNNFDSLNVSVAAGILCHQIYKNRNL
jgi:23S rRNA (guanosine2251-2'-O)-methyltransferase